MARSQTLAEIIADVLRHRLCDGVHVCGERLAESIIAQEMSVSQAAARDALRMLETEGWLVRRPRRGLTVRTFDSDEARELYAVRAHLESMALDWAMARAVACDGVDLAGLVAEGRIHAGINNGRGVRGAMAAFHDRLLALSGGVVLARTLRPILNQTRLLVNFRAYHERDENPAAQLTRYGELATHIRTHDGERAKAALSAIIDAERHAVMLTLDLFR